MTEKVKVTQKQFDWLERYKSDEEIDYAIDIQVHRKRPDSPIVDWKPSEVARAFYNGYEVEPEYKAGDWVTRENGVVGKITDLDSHFANLDNLEGIFSLNFKFLRHATPEEIKAEKERRVWKSIGREVGEFRDGDSARHVNGGSVLSIDFLKTCYEAGALEGFYPAESFVSFEEGESDA